MINFTKTRVIEIKSSLECSALYSFCCCGLNCWTKSAVVWKALAEQVLKLDTEKVNPWVTPSTTCSSVWTPASLSLAAYSVPQSRSGSNSAIISRVGGLADKGGSCRGAEGFTLGLSICDGSSSSWHHSKSCAMSLPQNAGTDQSSSNDSYPSLSKFVTG